MYRYSFPFRSPVACHLVPVVRSDKVPYSMYEFFVDFYLLRLFADEIANTDVPYVMKSKPNQEQRVDSSELLHPAAFYELRKFNPSFPTQRQSGRGDEGL